MKEISRSRLILVYLLCYLKAAVVSSLLSTSLIYSAWQQLPKDLDGDQSNSFKMIDFYWQFLQVLLPLGVAFKISWNFLR